MPEAVPLSLPSMGESVSEGTVARWLKSVGDQVDAGEPVVEVTTDKVDVEVPSPATGLLATIDMAEGAVVAVGATLGTITVIAGSRAAPAPAPAPTSTAVPAEEPAPSLPRAASPSHHPAPQPERLVPDPESAGSSQATPVGRRPVSPLARRAAALSGVNVASVAGSGPGGSIRVLDIDRASPHSAGTSQAGTAQGTPHLNGNLSGPESAVRDMRTAPQPPPGATVTPLKGPAAVLVEYMERSREIPTATSFRTLAVATLEGRRSEINLALSGAGRPVKVSFTHLIGHAVAKAAALIPAMSSHFARDARGAPVRVEGAPHLGLAVDSRRRDGSRFLVVPVIRDASLLSFAGFRDEYERLVARARDNALSADELKGATLTLTNPGGLGTVASVPRLMPEQGTIVAVGAIDHPPEWRSVSAARRHELGVSKVMTITSTYDHRVIQGAESGEFLQRVEALLEGADGFYEDVWRSLKLSGVPGRMADPAPAPPPSGPLPAAPPAVVNEAVGEGGGELLAAVGAAMSLVKAHRTHGHLGAHLDPLGSQPVGDPAMDPITVNLTPELMETVPAEVLRVYVPGRNLAEILPNLRSTYCGTIAYEIEHISSHEQRVWLREHIESGAHRLPLTGDERLRLLTRLTKVDAMERYLRRTFIGQKTFSGEGIDVIIPMLETLLTSAAELQVGQVVIGMAHRARLAIIAHVVNRPYEAILAAFERAEQRQPVGVGATDPTGDVKYHVGATGTYITHADEPITVRLLPNPSHLEAVDAVVEGWARAVQTSRTGRVVNLDRGAAMPVLVHGDAAFSAQGVVAEVLNFQALAGYSTGGTVHLIANNQVGFTTDPADARSTRYASDLAKGYDIPIVHVNADDVEACMAAVRLACDYRRAYQRDIVIDVIGYRRFGHNEADEPTYTQPLMYQRIKEHPTVRELFISQLVSEGLITMEQARAEADAAYQAIADAHQRVRADLPAAIRLLSNDRHAVSTDPSSGIPTAVDSATLRALGRQLVTVPDGFTVNPKLAKQLTRRVETLTEGDIDWGTAESLALASLLRDGCPIRFTGQDTERGTFSQRHLVFHDDRTGSTWIPMHHIDAAAASFELHNSPLSEVGCVGFEYGYSAAAPDALVLWEAQFGDFGNNAQMVIDQFIASGGAKWDQHARLTLLLPHGYEGAGPEHSSARLERFLQLAAHGNIRVANCSTSAQYFHLLRDQALAPTARPLVVMTPKSLLRFRAACCTLDDLSSGGFQPVLDDPTGPQRRDEVQTLLLCSGKMYYDLVGQPLYREATDLAVARVELLDPLPIEDILRLIELYPRLKQMFWVQEEPSNMGAWLHLARPIERRRPPSIAWDYVGRPRRASPSEGFAGSHHTEQDRIITTALSTSRIAMSRTGRGRPAASPRSSPPSNPRSSPPE